MTLVPNARLVASSHRRVSHQMGGRWKYVLSRAFSSRRRCSSVANGILVDAQRGPPDTPPVGTAGCPDASALDVPAGYTPSSSIDVLDSSSGRSPTASNTAGRRTRSRRGPPPDERPCLPQAGLDNDPRFVRG